MGTFVTGANAQSKLPTHQKLLSEREATPTEERQEHDHLQAAARYWYESRNPKHLADMDEALQRVLPLALKQSPWVIGVPTWEDAHHHRAYHDAGAILLAKGYTLLYYGRVEEALPVLNMVDEKLPHSLLLYQDRRLVQVRKSLSYHEHACALYAAIITKKMDVFQFPPERDEFDAESQRKAVADMAILRLKEGNYDALEHFFSQARLRQLKTASGRWVSEIIHLSMHPSEHESEDAWVEMGDRILEWRQNKPTSIDALLFELHYEMGSISRNKPKSKKAMLAKIAEVQTKLKEIGPVSPLVPQLQMIFSFLLEEDFSVAAGYFHDGYEKFPDYPTMILMMHLNLAKQDNGQSLCLKFLEFIGHSEHPQIVAMVLGSMPPLLVPVFTMGMDTSMLEASIRKAVTLHPHSLELRNDLGRLATLLKMPALAREVMVPVGARWDRQKWMGMEEEAARLTDKGLATRKPIGM